MQYKNPVSHKEAGFFISAARKINMPTITIDNMPCDGDLMSL